MMTTNYTRILNDNLDMFEDETMEREYSNGIGWSETDDGIEYEDDIDAKLYDYLFELKAKLETITDEKVWAETAAIYSDVYKDLHGCRPSGIGLRYHGI